VELITQKLEFDNAIDLLEINMKKKHKILPANLRKEFSRLLRKHADLLTLKRNRFIIPVQFYPIWIIKFKLALNGAIIDTSHYNFFRKLNKYGYTHQESSYFPKKKALISLNQNLSSIYKGAFQDISKYGQAKKSLYDRKLRKMSSSKITSYAYTDLRLFQAIKLTAKEIESINSSNIFFASKSSGYIYLEEIGIFDNITIPPYQLIQFQGKKLVKIFKKFQKNGIKYPFTNTDLENKLSLYRKTFLTGISMQDIRMASQNNILIQSSPLVTTLATSKSIMSQLTIAEVHSLHPNTIIPQHLINIEKERITYALTRTKEVDEENNFIDSAFDLKEFDHLNELLKTKTNSAFMKKIEPAKRELNQYVISTKSEAHGILITKYIVHLLSSVDKENKDRHIAISTFKNYYSLIKTHLFSNVEDLTNVQTHEINEILHSLAISRYKDTSIKNIKSLITDFFSFHGQKHNIIPMKLASYPKSLVLESEIDQILAGIEDNYKKDKQEAETDYKLLRDKAIILMARYTGLRKSELRSRLLKDIYIYNDILCIDVNAKGLKKLDMTLKTDSAKRRVCVEIVDANHLNTINDYIELRENMKTKKKFFFFHTHEKKPEVVKEKVFDNLTKIIQKVTGRYTSFHSLRHTFATYAVKEILECKEINPYKMIDLAVKMGHTSAGITLKKYVHRSVIEYIMFKANK